MSFQLPAYLAPDFSEARFVNAPNVAMAPAPRDGVAPEGFHSTGIEPEYFKINGSWVLAPEIRMDCVPVLRDNGVIDIVEFRHLKKGDIVILGRTEDGSEGIYVNGNPFATKESASLAFSFRKGRTRETGFSRDYQEIVDLLQYEKANGGYCVWVMGPAFTFDDQAREAFSKIVKAGYVQAVLAGNALATHDLEGAMLHTALGTDITTQKSQFNGHYNHLDAINRVCSYGSIPAFLEGEGLTDGIIASCVQTGVPFVLVGSVRDDGPLPEVFHDVYAGQDGMRAHVKRATTVIGMATTLHTIATGNMTPAFRVLEDGSIRPVYFYSVDTSDFSANKLADRGSLTAKGIVANAQDFITKVAAALGL